MNVSIGRLGVRDLTVYLQYHHDCRVVWHFRR